jgi:hypothetical protein
MIRLACLFSLSFFVLSCGISKKEKVVINKEGSKIALVEKVIQDSTISRYLISTNKVDTSELSLRYQFFIKVDEVWKDSVNRAIANFALTNCGIQPIENGAKSNNLIFQEALNNVKKDAEEDYEASDYASLWYYESSGTIVDERKSFVSISNSVSIYAGGAHPNNYFEYQCIDKKNGRRLSIEDIVNDTDAFNVIAEKYFRAENGFSPDESLAEIGFWFEEDVFKVNNNFSFSDGKIHFFFNQYEIAPYVMGMFEFSVPITLSEHLIKIDLSKN